MSSPEVWADARARLEAAAPGLGVAFAWPNEEFTLPADPSALWVAVEIAGDLAELVELGGGAWAETGSLYLHVMVPVGSGLTDGLMLRKRLALLFRGVAEPGGPAWYDARMDLAGPPDDSGLYRPLSLAIAYRFQDR